MPIEHSVDESKGRLVTTVSGVVTDAETVDYMRRLIADSSYPNGMDGLVFTDAIEEFCVTASAIKEAAEIAVEASYRFRGSRWAVIASRDPVFGMTRMFQLRRAPESYEVRVFRDSDPATEWLDAAASGAAADLSD